MKKLGAEWVEESDEDYSGSESSDEGAWSGGEGGNHSAHLNHQKDSIVPADPWIIHCRWRKDSLVNGDDGENDYESLNVHMEIQLYQLEHNFYLVDFKCAGYEPLEKETKSETKKRRVGFMQELGGDERGVIKGDDGKVEDKEKEVSSPFPFLELASRLIIQLAEAAE